MKNSIYLITIFALSLISSCKQDDFADNPSKENQSKIVGFNGSTFITDEGSPFFPWGFNYTNPYQVGLIEDNWDIESTWDMIEGDFQEMKDYGANTVRIHLQYNKFMTSQTTINSNAFSNLERLVQIGEDREIYFIVTGLASYRLIDSPIWYDELNDAERWETHKLFWQCIAQTLKNKTSIFAYDLINEPVVAVGCDTLPCSWYPENGSFDDYQFIQNISIDPDNDYWGTLATWTDLMTNEIRSEDEITLITVGLLPLGPINTISTNVDIVSTHIYPNTDDLSFFASYIANNQSDKPFLIEEFGNLHCSADELVLFLDQVEGDYHGMIGHYFGKTIEEYDTTVIVDVIHKNFLEFFIDNNPN